MKRTPLIIAAVLGMASNAWSAALEPYATWFRPHTSTAYVYVRNTTDQPLTLKTLSINGAAESATLWPLDVSRKSDWFDLVPPTVGPGQVGQVRVHLRDGTNAKPVALRVETSVGNVSATIPPTAAACSLSDITFAKDGSEASVFVKADAAVSRVLVDGADVTKECDLVAGTPYKAVAAVFYHPKSALVRGSYHTYEVVTTSGRRAIYTMRTVMNDFILGTYGQPNFSVYKDAGLNLYISFGRVPPAKVAELGALGMTASPVPFIGGEISAKTKEYKPLDVEATRENVKGLANSAVAFYSSPDEPDGADHPLGVGTHGRSIVAMRELAYSVDPGTPTFVQIDNTYRDFNYHVYAESMDYSATHRYNLGQEFQAADRGAMAELRESTCPQPYLWVTQLYPVRDKVGERVGYNGRHPLPAEMHVQMLESLAGGTKGFIHYIHSGSTGGRGGSGLDASLWASMPPMHRQVAAVGAVAVRSTPVAWAASSDARVHVQALFARPDDLLVVLTNEAIQSTKTGCVVPEVKGAVISVSLPPYCRITKVNEVLPGGELQKTNFTLENGVLTVRPEVVTVGTIYRLQGEH